MHSRTQQKMPRQKQHREGYVGSQLGLFSSWQRQNFLTFLLVIELVTHSLTPPQGQSDPSQNPTIPEKNQSRGQHFAAA